jgi:catechol 2,3-dioxygenase-like lactoylglutathione lyase family enzyme
MLRISDLTYLVRDQEEAIRFFVDVLGFVVRSDEVSPGRRRVVVGPDGGGPGLVLKLAPDSPLVGRQADGRVLFFLHTDDFAATHARLREHGVTFREEPRHEPWGTVVIFEDLYGQPWDLIQPPSRP